MVTALVLPKPFLFPFSCRPPALLELPPSLSSSFLWFSPSPFFLSFSLFLPSHSLLTGHSEEPVLITANQLEEGCGLSEGLGGGQRLQVLPLPAGLAVTAGAPLLHPALRISSQEARPHHTLSFLVPRSPAGQTVFIVFWGGCLLLGAAMTFLICVF